MADAAQKFTEWLGQHRSGVADVELTELFEELVAAVGRSSKKGASGTLTLKVKVRKEGDMVAVTDVAASSVPDETEARLYWVGIDGELTRNNPLQPSLLDQKELDRG